MNPVAWLMDTEASADLLRRATYDLIGLPPTPRKSGDFVRDHSPNAFAKVVDRLLASPALRRALGPLLARYRALQRHHGGDRDDNNRADYRYPFAWTYRDYVIKAFNDGQAVRPVHHASRSPRT